MTEEEQILSYIDKPFSELLRKLLANGYKSTGGQFDRVHNLNKVVFIAHNKAKHLKVTVWHMWLRPDSFGIAKPGLVTDIDVKDLEPKEDLNNVRTN
jgi:hypothetical protein